MKTGIVALWSITTIMTIFFRIGNSNIVTAPRNTVTVLGRLVYFNCSSDIQPPHIQWHCNYGVDDYQHIYAGDHFVSPYERFRIEIDNSTGSYNLVIPNVTKNDAGTYRCLDKEGHGEKRSAELVVLDADPVCSSDMKADGIVGPNSCNVDPEAARFSCSATYHGNIAPMLRWTRIGDSRPMSTGIICKNSTNRVECNLTIKADLHLDGSSYICHTDTTTDINCTSDPVNIIYAFNDFRVTEKSINDALTCKANSSQPCNHRWIWDAGTGTSIVLGLQPTVAITKSGIYRCESNCSVQGKQCTVSAMLVYIPSGNKSSAGIPPPTSSETKTNADSSKTALIVLVTVLAILLIACIISAVCYYRRRRNKKTKKRQNSSESHRLNDTKEQTENSAPENESIKQKYENLESELQKSKSEWSSKEDELKLQKTELEQRLAAGERQIGELKNKMKDRESEWSAKEDDLKQEKTDLELRLTSEADKIKEKLDDVERQKTKLEAKVKQLVKRANELGLSLCLPPKEPIEYKVEPPLTIQTQAGQGPKNIGVCGVAVLDNELFVISDGHPEIEVFDLAKLDQRRSIELKAVIDPGDIVACNKYKRIYIVDWTDRNLQNKLLSLDAKGKEEKKPFPLADDECRLFITKDSNILVTFHRSRKVIEYTPDMDVIVETKIKDSNVFPIHAVRLSNSLLAISHGLTKELLHRVCIVSDDGSLLKSFGGPKGSGIGSVNSPTYLAVDRNDDILVTNRGNGRVLVLNSRLELTIELLTGNDQLRLPRALFLDEANNRLFVADCNKKFLDGRILIFHLK